MLKKCLRVTALLSLLILTGLKFADAMDDFARGLIAAPEPPAFSEAEQKTLAKGEVVVREEHPTHPSLGKILLFRSYIIISGNIADGWNCFLDWDRLWEFQPLLTETRIIKKEERRVWTRLRLKVFSFPVLYHNEYELFPEEKIIYFQLDKSREHTLFKDAIGIWRFYPLDEAKYLLEYSNFVDPGRMVPKFVYNELTGRQFPNILGMVKKRLESGCAWRKKPGS